MIDKDDSNACIKNVYFNTTIGSASSNCDLNCNKDMEFESGSSYRVTEIEPCGNFKAKLYAVGEAGCSEETTTIVLSKIEGKGNFFSLCHIA